MSFTIKQFLFSLAAMGVDVGYLFSSEKANKDLTNQEQALLEDYRHMNEQGKLAVTTSARAMAQQELFKKCKVS